MSSGFFVLRTPLHPIEEFLELCQPPGGEPEGHKAAGGDHACARAGLRRFVERPEVREALWLASPELVQSLRLWLENPDSAKGLKLELALYRYLARMTARATPFGAFAGCSVGEISGATRLELGPRSRYRRSTRLDMEYLCSLAETVSSDPIQRRNVRFRRNTSLHLAAGKYHHVRGEWQEGDRVFELVATDPTPALDATLLRAAAGATAGALASALVESDPEIAPEEADTFMQRLITSQLLVSELSPPVTGPEPVRYMAEQLEQAEASALAAGLVSVAEELRALDRGGLGADLRTYDKIAGTVSRLGGEFRPGRLIQVDVIKPAAAASLDRRLVDDILGAVQTLHSIRGDSSQPAFEPFQEQFRERYQEREVPLLEALDDEAGVGFENEDNPTSEPLIAGIDFCPAEATLPEESASAGPLLARRLEELRAAGGTVLELDRDLLEELKAANPLPLPDAFSVMGALVPGPAGQQGFYLQNIAGPSGANLLARFCHADSRLVEGVCEHLRAEEALHRGGAVLAEVAHLPEGRVGNVVCRPALRQYEIPFLATSGVPVERQIALSDLTVSLRDGRIVLRSRRLGCEVLPRLTSAHNFANPRSLKLYKFLCLLQHQGACADMSWSWGAHQEEAFLPRVALGNIVFSLARWRISQETARALMSEAHGRTRGVEEWRKACKVPRFAFIVEADNQLLIDFENALSMETFLDHIRKRPETLLVEMFPAPGDLPVRGPEGRFVHEMVLPFVRRRPRAAAAPTKAGAARTEISTASAAAGVEAESGREAESGWLFAKLYCSPSHADRLLLELVQPLVREVVDAGAVRGWFFMRYGDPRWHLRLRYCGDPLALRAHVLPALLERAAVFQRQGVVWRLQFDVYEPEVARYGGALGIGLAEQFFQWSSELCLELLPLISGDSGAELRWQLAFAGVDRLLSGLGFATAGKKDLAEQMRDLREEAWLADEDYRRQLGRKYRSGTLRHTLAAILNEFEVGAGRPGVLPAEALAAFARFSQRLRLIHHQLRALDEGNQLTTTIPDLAVSYAHMHLNRMLRSCHLEQETVLYDLLARTYAAKLAREKTLTTG